MALVARCCVVVLCCLLGCSSRPRVNASADAGTAALHIGDHCRPDQGWQRAASADGGGDPNAPPPIGVGYCGQWPEAPEGYYTARCKVNGDCPDGARCGIGSYWCVKRCRSNDDCIPPASCHLSAAAAVSYCQVTGGVLARGDRDAGASEDCELPCGFYQTCCQAQCFDLANDPEHCGHCDRACGPDAPYCEDGKCVKLECAESCAGGACCGDACCAAGETCCAIYGADGPTPTCVALHEAQRCPSGCHDCAR